MDSYGTTKIINDIKYSLSIIKERIKYDDSLLKIEELNSILEDEQLWNTPQKANEILQKKITMENKVNTYKQLNQELEYNIELLKISEEENEQETTKEAIQELKDIKEKTLTIELNSLLNEPHDQLNCFLEVHSGAGGTEAQDWANMILRMYTRWANKENFKIEYIEEQAGDVEGIKSATILIKGTNAYGWLQFEKGVHRLVRISPFDSNAKRHTSFCAVDIYPEINNNIDIQINSDDLKIDTYRSSGAGGQHVNTTDSAIRITHLPTNTVVQCQKERSQHRNKEIAMKMLKAKIYEQELQKKKKQQQELQDNKTDNGWGYKIRSYVLQPYQMVKDLRTNHESNSPIDVLNGNINSFLQSSLSKLKS